MKEDICSIPINEMFEPKEGCPLCRMDKMLEDRLAEYITGAAMMEPDVRIETNRLGFCTKHFDKIVSVGGRLSVALILESHLQELEERAFEGTEVKKKLFGSNSLPESGHGPGETCFICENMDNNRRHLYDSLIHLWLKEEEFRRLYKEQECICLSHARTLVKIASASGRKSLIPFIEDTKELSLHYLQEVSKDITHFCRMFDYRSAGKDWGNSKDAIERSIAYLTARMTPQDDKPVMGSAGR